MALFSLTTTRDISPTVGGFGATRASATSGTADRPHVAYLPAFWSSPCASLLLVSGALEAVQSGRQLPVASAAALLAAAGPGSHLPLFWEGERKVYLAHLSHCRSSTG